jgi:hypothetical protein
VKKIRQGGVDGEMKVCPAKGSIWVALRDVPEFERALRRAPTIMKPGAMPKAPAAPAAAPPDPEPELVEIDEPLDTIRPPVAHRPPSSRPGAAPRPAAAPALVPKASVAPPTARSSRPAPPRSGYWLVATSGVLVLLVGAGVTLRVGEARGLAVMLIGLAILVMAGQLAPSRR